MKNRVKNKSKNMQDYRANFLIGLGVSFIGVPLVLPLVAYVDPDRAFFVMEMGLIIASVGSVVKLCTCCKKILSNQNQPSRNNLQTTDTRPTPPPVALRALRSIQPISTPNTTVDGAQNTSQPTSLRRAQHKKH